MLPAAQSAPLTAANLPGQGEKLMNAKGGDSCFLRVAVKQREGLWAFSEAPSRSMILGS